MVLPCQNIVFEYAAGDIGKVFIYVARRIHPKGTRELSLSLKALVCMKTLFHFTNRSIQLAFG